jgi:DNA-directed RNA polymerase subunit K/omega
MIELPEGFDSVFRYIVVVSQRAEQLINGAKPRTDGRHPKATLTAKDDVDTGQVPWRVLTQEELDAQRQAIVDQFRAEMAGEEFAAEPERPVRDVLPTSADREPRHEEIDAGERDDELARLQRLLGMAGGQSDEEVEEEGSAEENGDGDQELADIDEDLDLDEDEDEDEDGGDDLDLDEDEDSDRGDS